MPENNKNCDQNMVNNEVISDKNTNHVEELLKKLTEDLDDIMSSKNQVSTRNRIATGFKELNQILFGFYNGDLNIIASRPGIGKTFFALTLFSKIIRRGVNSLYISFDKNEMDLMKYYISIKAGFNSQLLENGNLSVQDYTKFVHWFCETSEIKNIHLKSFFNASLIELKDFIKEKVSNDNISIVFIDYLHMIVPSLTCANRWEQISEISRSLKSMAMEFRIPFIVLCPFHININEDTPEINDLTEYSTIEFNADRIMILYENKKIKQKDVLIENTDIKPVSLFVSKNRRGETVTLDFMFNYKYRIIEVIKN